MTAGLVALVGTAAARPPVSHTLRRTWGGSIDALAQDGGAVAWLASGGSACNAVHVLSDGKTQLAPDPAAGSMTCRWDLAEQQPELALAAGAQETLWTLHEDGPSPVDYVMTADFDGPERRLDRLAHASDGTGLWLGGVAGAGQTLAYSVVEIKYVDQIACLSGGSCKQRISGGGVRTVSDGRATPLPGAEPALELAASAGRLAYVPASGVDASGAPTASASGGVEVVDATSGTSVSEVQPQGVPLALGLSRHTLAILTRDGRRDRISWYDADDGTQLGSVTVSARTAPQLALSDRIAVYRIGRTLRGLVLGTSRSRMLGKVSGTPVGLTLAHGLLAWAENRGGMGRIRTLPVG